MSEQGKRIAIFVDGEGFTYMLRNLFHSDEFHRSDYLPRNANWKWFFNAISSALGAELTQVYWFSIRELDYYPEGNWQRLPFDVAERKLKGFPHIAERLEEQPNLKARKQVVNEYRESIPRTRAKMEKRVIEWQQIQDQIAKDFSKVKIRRPGWQACSLVDSKLHDEKAVDVGMVVEMLAKSDTFDIAMILTADGDFVPVVKELRKRGKENACIYFPRIKDRQTPKIARRLTKEMDYVVDLSVEDLAAFMGIELSDKNQ